MSLLIVFSDLKSLLTNFPADAKEDIVAYLEDLSSDIADSRNPIGMYHHDPKYDGMAETTAEELVEKMNGLIKTFNKEMVDLIGTTEREFKKSLVKKER